MNVDVLIAGYGPAGAAAAICLKQMSPGLRICLTDSGKTAPPVGEGAPPPVRQILQQLGLWDDFRAQGHLEAHRTHAAWGSDRLQANEFLLLGKGNGWTLDRVAFDTLLCDRATGLADEVVSGRLTALKQVQDGWQASIGEREVFCRAVVDASGRAAASTRLLGGKPEVGDRLVAAFTEAEVDELGETGVIVESACDGWWYTAPTGPRTRMWAWLTDSDLFRQHRLDTPERWQSTLGDTRHVGNFARNVEFGIIHVVPAMSQTAVLNDDALSVLPAGDAASTFDPASSQGITTALRSGLFAGYALHDWFGSGENDGLLKYRQHLRSELEAYRGNYQRHYAAETRWADQPFWQRRIA